MNDRAARRNARCRGARPVGPWVGPGEQGETRRRIVARRRDLRLSPGERSLLFAHHALGNGSSGMTGSSADTEVSVELVCVFPAERRGVLLQPFAERDSPERRLVRDQQPGGQAADLVGGERDIAHNNPERVRKGGHEGRRCVQDRRASP
jgi:hypothetical protein